MKNVMKRGFTLIELLVVIPIIGILAAVVLGSLNDARSGGQNASIQQTMASMRTQAEVYYNGTGGFSYSGICADADTLPILTAALNVVNGDPYDAADDEDAQAANDVGDESQRTAGCSSNASGYQMTVPLAGPGDTYWCIDSSGGVGELAEAALPGATDTTCS